MATGPDLVRPYCVCKFWLFTLAYCHCLLTLFIVIGYCHCLLPSLFPWWLGGWVAGWLLVVWLVLWMKAANGVDGVMTCIPLLQRSGQIVRKLLFPNSDYVCMYIYIHIIYNQAHKHTPTHPPTHTHTHKHTQIDTHTNTHTHTHIPVCDYGCSTHEVGLPTCTPLHNSISLR